MKQQTRITIPMPTVMRSKLVKRANALGFDSAQAMFRYIGQAVIDERTDMFGEDSWGQPSPRAMARLDRLAEEAIADSKAGKLKAYYTAEEFLRSLDE